MLTIKDTPDFLNDMYVKYKLLSKEIYQAVKDQGKQEELPGNTDLLAYIQNNNSYVYLMDGYWKLNHGSRLIRLYSNSDLVFSNNSFAKEWTLNSELATCVTVFDKNTFLTSLKDKFSILEKWAILQDMENKINLSLCSLYMEEDIQPDFTCREYNKGDVIIKEGDEPKEFFEMISGFAIVLNDNREIGRINEKEFFGEISFLTESTRTATIEAEEKCFVRVVTKENFLKLIKCNPQLVLAISKTLAHRIVQLNEKIIGKII